MNFVAELNSTVMKPITKTLGLFFVFTLICKCSIAQQLAIDKDASKQIVCQFNSYSVAKDKLLQQEFKKSTPFKIIYSCLPAGIVVIEGQNNLSEQDIELIKQKTNNIDVSYTVLQNITLKAVESKCATYRSN